jgi:hypothetical protein
MLKRKERTYGVELEVAGLSEEQAYIILNMMGIPVVDPRAPGDADRMNKWRIHHDGSIKDTRAQRSDIEERTCELVSPILRGPKGLKQIKKVCAVIKKAGGYVNQSCGLHVHVGAEDLTPEHVMSILNRYAKYEPIIDTFMHHGRRLDSDNQYCGSVSDTLRELDFDKCIRRCERQMESHLQSIASVNNKQVYCYTCGYRTLGMRGPEHCGECRGAIRMYNEYIQTIKVELESYQSRTWPSVDIMAKTTTSRYRNINLQAFTKHKTIEFRQHHGTLDGTKISNWVSFILNFVERSCLAADKGRRIRDKNVLSGLSKRHKEHYHTREKITSRRYDAWA